MRKNELKSENSFDKYYPFVYNRKEPLERGSF